MSWMEFVSNLVHWLAIPAAIVVVCWLFRERIRDLIDRVSHIEAPGGISADLDPTINNVLGQAGQVGRQLTADRSFRYRRRSLQSGRLAFPTRRRPSSVTSNLPTRAT
jgi:hypothetical protein